MYNNKLPFSMPVIDTAGNNPEKHWQIRYQYSDKAGRRITKRFSKGLNEPFLTFDEKMQRAVKLRDDIFKQLILGQTEVGKFDLPNKFQPVFFALDSIASYKKQVVTKNTFKPYLSNIKHFKNYLEEKDLSVKFVSEIESGHIYKFLEWVREKKSVSNRTVNNIIVDIRSTWSMFVKMDYCKTNICQHIDKLPARSTRNKVFGKEDVRRIKYWCEQNDPYLYLFCKFVMMGVRPQAAVQIRVKDIDTEEFKIVLPAAIEKTAKRTVKVIFERFREDFVKMELWKYPANYFFFTCDGAPGPKRTTRDWFTRKFHQMKKELGLGREYTLYGWKHTIAVELFKNGTNMRDIMAITGHTTLSGFEAYIREYLDECPKDPSGNIFLPV